jgi:hypothetical protein
MVKSTTTNAQGQGKNQTSVSQMKTKPQAAIGKRGLCAEGVSNTVNKCIRSSEDVVLAMGLQYNLNKTAHGIDYIKGNIAMLQGAYAMLTAYTALQATGKTDLDIITSAKISATVLGQIQVLTMFLSESK